MVTHSTLIPRLTLRQENLALLVPRLALWPIAMLIFYCEGEKDQTPPQVAARRLFFLDRSLKGRVKRFLGTVEDMVWPSV